MTQFSSVAQSCPALCNPMDCSTPGFSVHPSSLSLLKLMSSSQWCHPTISSSVVPFFSSCLQSFPASGSFPMSEFFASVSQSIDYTKLNPHNHSWWGRVTCSWTIFPSVPSSNFSPYPPTESDLLPALRFACVEMPCGCWHVLPALVLLGWGPADGVSSPGMAP